MIGRGVSYTERNGTVVAMIAEVEVERSSGRVWAKKFTVAHDCGQIINPGGLKLTIEGNVCHALSRTLFEEVRFDSNNVRSVDWVTYPILELADAPESIDIVLINRPEMAPQGAGEPSHRTVPGAIANAIFDATGDSHAPRADHARADEGRPRPRLSPAGAGNTESRYTAALRFFAATHNSSPVTHHRS